jgi:hypothetical protein
MQLKLERKWFTERSSIGELFLDDQWECYTLEDPVQPVGVKISGDTAIPEGTYTVIINWSNRFKRLLPLLVGVPGFEGIRIHVGNVPEDTEGCILVGQARGDDIIYRSARAFGALFEKLYEAFPRERIEITIFHEA